MIILTFFALASLGSHITNYVQWPPSGGEAPIAMKSSKVKAQPKVLPYDPKRPTPMYTGDSSDMLKIYQHHFAPPTPEQERQIAEAALEYDQILQLERAGKKRDAVQQMQVLIASDRTGQLGALAGNRLRIDHEELGDFKDIFVPIESVKMQLNMPGYPGPEFWTLEAATGAELGYVFKGERKYLESIFNSNPFMRPILKFVDRGDDPKSIAIFAWSVYRNYVAGDNREELVWLDQHVSRLDPSDDYLYFGSFGDRVQTDPKSVLIELKLRFPNGPLREFVDQYQQMVDQCNWYTKHPVTTAQTPEGPGQRRNKNP